MESASYGGSDDNSVKKSLKTRCIVFRQAEEKKNKQNLSFRTGVRSTWLLRFRVPAYHCFCSAGPWATGVPRDWVGGPQGALTPYPAIPSAQGQSSACSSVLFTCKRALSNHTRQLAWQ